MEIENTKIFISCAKEFARSIVCIIYVLYFSVTSCSGQIMRAVVSWSPLMVITSYPRSICNQDAGDVVPQWSVLNEAMCNFVYYEMTQPPLCICCIFNKCIVMCRLMNKLLMVFAIYLLIRCGIALVINEVYVSCSPDDVSDNMINEDMYRVLLATGSFHSYSSKILYNFNMVYPEYLYYPISCIPYSGSHIAVVENVSYEYHVIPYCSISLQYGLMCVRASPRMFQAAARGHPQSPEDTARYAKSVSSKSRVDPLYANVRLLDSWRLSPELTYTIEQFNMDAPSYGLSLILLIPLYVNRHQLICTETCNKSTALFTDSIKLLYYCVNDLPCNMCIVKSLYMNSSIRTCTQSNTQTIIVLF